MEKILKIILLIGIAFISSCANQNGKLYVDCSYHKNELLEKSETHFVDIDPPDLMNRAKTFEKSVDARPTEDLVTIREAAVSAFSSHGIRMTNDPRSCHYRAVVFQRQALLGDTKYKVNSLSVVIYRRYLNDWIKVWSGMGAYPVDLDKNNFFNSQKILESIVGNYGNSMGSYVVLGR